MVPIYICDDNLNMLEHLKRIIKNTVLINGYDMKINLAVDCPHRVLEMRRSQDIRSIYFLDIELKNEDYNGITLAKEIRKIDARGFIVFITTHSELMAETFKYQVEAINYIIKDNTEILKEQVSASLNEINALIGADKQDPQDYYTVKAADTVYHVPMKEILFFETSAAHRVTLHSKHQNVDFRGDLSKIEQEMSGEYLRVHQSFLVNKEAVNELDKKTHIARLIDGSEIPISRRGRKVLL